MKSSLLPVLSLFEENQRKFNLLHFSKWLVCVIQQKTNCPAAAVVIVVRTLVAFCFISSCPLELLTLVLPTFIYFYFTTHKLFLTMHLLMLMCFYSNFLFFLFIYLEASIQGNVIKIEISHGIAFYFM